MEKKRNRGALSAEALDFLDHALEHLRAVVAEATPGGRILHVSPSIESVLGYSPEEIRRRRVLELVDDPEQVHALAEELRQIGAASATLRARHKSGHAVWLSVSATRYEDPEGRMRLFFAGRDVSDREAAVEALRESEERYRALIENAADLIVEVDSSGRYCFVTPNVVEILGRQPEELLGRTAHELAAEGIFHPDDAEGLDLRAGGYPSWSEMRGGREYRLLHGDGSWHSFQSRFSAFRASDGGWRAVTSLRDVTAQRRSEADLRESEARYRRITETAQEIIAESDLEGRVLYVSPAVENVLGYRPEEVIGRRGSMLLIHPDDVASTRESFHFGELTGEPQYSEPHRVRHRDGSWRWLESTGLRYQRPDGETRVLMIIRDVTVRREAEEQRRVIEERMQQAQRLEGLGVMAGGIAHDFNNLLTPILGDASLALMDLPPDSPARSRIEKIQKAARRAASLTQQMLAYAGKGSLRVAPLSLSALVREMAQLLETSVSRRSELRVELAEGLPPVQGDAAQLSQVVLNLITNAAEAVGESGGRIAIRTGATEIPDEPDPAWLGGPLPPGPAVYLEVEDDGCGMDDATRTRIFDPFFTTKFTGRGLGLAAALGIVRSHGGMIEIDTAPGRGTRFRVILPRTGTSATPQAEPTAAIESWRANGMVLVIEDDDAVRQLMRDTLERCGLRVLAAADPRTGIEVFRRHATSIDLVVLDRTMPSANSRETARALRRAGNGVPILLVSGYSEERATGTSNGDDFADFLQKPFHPSALLSKVRAIFES